MRRVVASHSQIHLVLSEGYKRGAHTFCGVVAAQQRLHKTLS